MDDSLRTFDLTQLNLDEATRQVIQRLLNHIETLEAELQELREENQRLRDEVARLKGQKGAWFKKRPNGRIAPLQIE